MEIDVDEKDYIEFGKPELKERTRDRLSQMKDMGMVAFHNAQFGVEGLLSGIWLEYVWADSDEDWDSRMEWAESLIEKVERA